MAINLIKQNKYSQRVSDLLEECGKYIEENASEGKEGRNEVLDMEPWWFLEPLAYTSFISLAFSVFIAFMLDAILDFDNDSNIPVYIILIGAIPGAIFLKK